MPRDSGPMKLLLPLLLAVPLMACATTTPASPEENFARFGERTFVDGPHVEPVSLIEDSRCPIDAQCVWEGRLRITARVITGPDKQVVELTLGEPVQIADGALELVEATPLPETGSDISEKDYRFKFRFDGGY